MENELINRGMEKYDLTQEFERVIVPAIYRCLQSENYHEALETLNDFYRVNVDKYDNILLTYKCDSWKALILEKQGKYQEALLFYQALAEAMGRQHPMFTYLQLDAVRLLDKLGNYKQAIIELEKILIPTIDNSISEKLTALNLYVEICQNCQEEVGSKYHNLVAHLVNELGIDCQEKDLLKPSNIRSEIKDLYLKNQEANQRYSRMLIELDTIEEDSQAEVFIKGYIAQESVGYYRNLALKQLEDN